MLGTARRIHETLALLEAKGADSVLIADAAIAIWHKVDAALSPIIGQRGVIALYRRSIFIHRADYPWLMTAHDHTSRPDEFAALHTALSRQSSSVATATNGVLVHTFHDLLGKLIGASLTERLLQSVPDNLSNGDAVQDTSP